MLILNCDENWKWNIDMLGKRIQRCMQKFLSQSFASKKTTHKYSTYFHWNFTLFYTKALQVCWATVIQHRIHYNSIAFLNENTRNGNFFYYLMPLCGSDENKEILCLKFEVSMRSNIFWASNRSHMIQLRKWKSLYQLGPKIVYNYEIFTA